MTLKADIFCKVVDNFGDIGFCWRLARQLSHEHQLSVRLWVDDWNTAAKLIPQLPAKQSTATEISGVEVLSWNADADFSLAADIVLETFACGIPEKYQQAMQSGKTVWVNIDHLSAETWVDDFHAQISPQANGLKKYFYFPGFTEKSGGLIRERAMAETLRDLPESDGCLTLSLFAYPHAPVGDLFNAILSSQQETACYVPESVLLPVIAQYFEVESLNAGQVLHRENLHVHILPFLNQIDYDSLLRSCDINFVRGEDSWVRAIWAGKPFIWQPYLQEGDTHVQKLEAFLNVFYAGEGTPALQAMHHAWNSPTCSSEAWTHYLENQPEIEQVTVASQRRQMQQQDLSSQLLAFCHSLLLS